MMFIIIKTFHLISQQFAQVYTPTSDPSYFTPVFTYFPAVFPPVNSQSEVNQPRNPLFSSPPSSSFSFSTSSSFSYPSFSVPHSFFSVHCSSHLRIIFHLTSFSSFAQYFFSALLPFLRQSYHIRLLLLQHFLSSPPCSVLSYPTTRRLSVVQKIHTQ